MIDVASFAYTMMLVGDPVKSLSHPTRCLHCHEAIPYRTSCFRQRGRHDAPKFLCYACGLARGCCDPRPASARDAIEESATQGVPWLPHAIVTTESASVPKPDIRPASKRPARPTPLRQPIKADRAPDSGRLPAGWRQTTLIVLGERDEKMGRLVEMLTPRSPEPCVRCCRPANSTFAINHPHEGGAKRAICSSECLRPEYRIRGNPSEYFRARRSRTSGTSITKPSRRTGITMAAKDAQRQVSPHPTSLTEPSPRRDGKQAQKLENQQKRAHSAARIRNYFDRIAERDNWDQLHGVSIHGKL